MINLRILVSYILFYLLLNSSFIWYLVGSNLAAVISVVAVFLLGYGIVKVRQGLPVPEGLINYYYAVLLFCALFLHRGFDYDKRGIMGYLLVNSVIFFLYVSTFIYFDFFSARKRRP